MSDTVDYNTVSTVGVESSPVATALAGLRANEARYFKNKYGHEFTVETAADAKTTVPLIRASQVSANAHQASGLSTSPISAEGSTLMSQISVDS